MIDDMVRFNFDRDLKLAMPEGNNSMNGKFFFIILLFCLTLPTFVAA